MNRCVIGYRPHRLVCAHVVHAGDGRVELHVGFDFLPTEGPLGRRCVHLVHQQDDLHLLVGVAVLLDERLPVAQVIEAGASGDVDDQEEYVYVARIHFDNASKPFLTGCVPEVQSHVVSFVQYVFRMKVYADGRVVLCVASHIPL